MKQLLGSKAEEAEKRVTSEDPGNTRRRVDTIGWEIRMGTVEEEPSIGVSNRNLRKALFRFLSIDEANEVTLEELQRLAGSAHDDLPVLAGLHGRPVLRICGSR